MHMSTSTLITLYVSVRVVASDRTKERMTKMLSCLTKLLIILRSPREIWVARGANLESLWGGAAFVARKIERLDVAPAAL
eukprot:XP_001709142.1 Hypothetical protein GL50803_91611 [Giardia lamblia ATCC 50803]